MARDEIRIDPSSAGAYVALAQGYLGMNRTDAARQLAWAKGKELEFLFLTAEKDALLEQGKMRSSEAAAQRSLEIEKAQGLQETAESNLGWLATAQADFGVCDRALKSVASLGGSSMRGTVTIAAYVFATCGQP